MTTYLESSADILQYAVPAIAGVSQLAQSNYIGFGVFCLASLIHKVALPKIKKLFPDSIRPNGNSGSFPSSHTSAATMGAVFMLMQAGISVSSITLVALAGLTAFSRWYTEHHWVSDLLGGALVGGTLGSLSSITVSHLTA